MASADIGVPKSLEKPSPSSQNGSIDKLTDSLDKVSLQNDNPKSTTATDKNDDPPARPLHVYRRPHILFLSKSPLVTQPDGMPSLKDWFGDWNEQQSNSKKDPEQTTAPPNARERRFRRDVDDGDASARPPYRSTPSQFSQMGNFRHQSIRNTDRDKDKDGDRERERDIRDKEGQERLRSGQLSDKYDRDRLAMTSGTTIRNKDRDAAPHLNSGRDTSKRKIGDNSDDWRRVGPETTRGGRDDRAENSRRDRDNRERPRSRSRPRREPSATRKDRDRDEKDRDRRDRRGDDRDDHRRDDYPTRRDRDDYFRRDWDDHYSRDRDDHFREGRDRYDYSRQQRDLDRDLDDDPRRWRDDGKRDERLTTRRERDRGWDRWEPSHDRDRADDRDGRGKRPPARDRRTGGTEDGKDKDERREREREKEKEPAWMETYIPPATGGGILGGQGVDGELDGIQAWKKGLKEKERKEKEPELSPDPASKPTNESPESATPAPSDGPLDEIQLFKLMMKREAERKDLDSVNGSPTTPAATVPCTIAAEEAPSGLGTQAKPGKAPNGERATVTPPGGRPTTASVGQSNPSSTSPDHLTHSSPPSTLPSGDSRSLLSLITSGTTNSSLSSPLSKPPSQPTHAMGDGPHPAVSRVFPTPLGISPSSSQGAERSAVDPANSTSLTPFNPPQGSRLLAFGSRAPSAASATSSISSSKPSGPLDPQSLPRIGPIPPGVTLSNIQKLAGPPQAGPVTLPQLTDTSPSLGSEPQYNPRATPSEPIRSGRSFSPFPQGSQANFVFDDGQESMHVTQAQEHLRRGSVVPAADRAQYGLPSEGGVSYNDYNAPPSNFPPNGSYDMGPGNLANASYATGKGSRFAKFFDPKSREVQNAQGVRKAPGLLSTSPHPGQRQDPLMMNGLSGNPGDNRTMEDIFAMLQNSAQTHHRVSPQIGQPGRIPSGGGPYGQNAVDLQALQLQHLHHQQQQQQQFIQQSRLDSLYDSRMDDRNFVPDGMVPGLRPVPRPRSREPTGVLFNDQLDDPLHFNVQRIPQQSRNLEQVYPGQAPLYNQHQHGLGRAAGVQLQQAQFRGGPSPISSQNPLQGPSQRLPPGLANLGGRPPHDPSQYLGSQIGASGAGIPGGIHPNPQQGFGGNFGGGGLGYGGGPQGRGPVPGPHLQNPLALNQMAGLNPANNLDLRGPSQAQLLGLGAGGGLRGAGGNFVAPNSQMQVPHPVMRQQQQQQLPPQMLPQMLPPHLQQQQGIPSGNSQGTQDLMALLMGGHRD